MKNLRFTILPALCAVILVAGTVRLLLRTHPGN